MEDRKQQALDLKIDGDKLYKKELHQEALKLYLQAIELDPLQIDTYFNIAKTYIKINEIEKAKDFFEKALKVSPENEKDKTRKGMSGVFFGAKNYEEAFNIFKPLIDNLNNEQDVFIALRFSIASNNIDTAKKILADNVEKYPNLIEKVVNDQSIPNDKKQTFLESQSDVIPQIKEKTEQEYVEFNQFLKGNENKFKQLPEFSNWKTEYEQFNSANKIDNLLEIKNKLPETAVKLQTAIVSELHKSNKAEIETLNNKIGFLNFANQHLTGSLKQQTNKLLSDINSFKQSIQSSDYKTITEKYLELENYLNEAKKLESEAIAQLSNTVKESIENKQIGTAQSINNELKRLFPNEQQYKDNVQLITGKSKKKKTTYAIIGAAALVVIIVLIIAMPKIKENSAWNAAKEENTGQAYKNFVENYPNSSKIEQLETILYNLVNSLPTDERTMIYNIFRMRDKPNLNGTVLKDLKQGEVVKILEKGTEKDEIALDNYNAIDYWYKVETSAGDIGWTFGGGLKMSDSYYYACKLYIEQFPVGKNLTQMKDKYQLADCNYWEDLKANNNTVSYENYVKYFPTGMYSEDANFITEFWKKESKLEDYALFKSKYPNTMYNDKLDTFLNPVINKAENTPAYYCDGSDNMEKCNYSAFIANMNEYTGKYDDDGNGSMFVNYFHFNKLDNYHIIFKYEISKWNSPNEFDNKGSYVLYKNHLFKDDRIFYSFVKYNNKICVIEHAIDYAQACLDYKSN